MVMSEDDVWDFVWDELGSAWTRSLAKMPSRLYHYTNSAGFHGIVEFDSLRATNVGFLNDELELQYVSSVVRKTIAATPRQANSRKQQLLDTIQDDLDEALQEAAENLFVISFSTMDDDLSQWRSYAGAEGGFAVGFSTEELRKRLTALRKSKSAPARALLRPVLYGDDAVSSLVNNFLTASMKKFDSSLRGVTVSKSKELIEWWKSALVARLVTFAPFGKHHQFKSENECRIVLTLSKRRPTSGVKFIPKSTVLAAYLEVNGTNECIRRVGAGPGRHRTLNKSSAERFLKSKDLDATFYESDAPYRPMT